MHKGMRDEGPMEEESRLEEGKKEATRGKGGGEVGDGRNAYTMKDKKEAPSRNDVEESGI